MAPTTPLETELRFYQDHLAEWLQQFKGQYALIKGAELIGTFTTQEEAYEEGVKRFGAEPFLIRPITEDQPPEQMPAFFLGLSNARLS